MYIEQQIDISEYDLTQDDEVDESHSKGIWDLSIEMLESVGNILGVEIQDNQARDDAWTFIYHFLRDFKNVVLEQDKYKFII